MTHTTDTGAQADPQCPFCGLDPYEYVDIGVGTQAVAVNCCEYGQRLFQYGESYEALSREVRDDLQATIATLTALPKELSDSIIRRDATIATQAARIVELEKQVAWKEGLIRQLTDVDMPAMQADNERLRAELALITQWVPVPDGQIPESNLWIVSAHGDGWFLEFGKNGAKVWFPGVVRLYVDSTRITVKEGDA